MERASGKSERLEESQRDEHDAVAAGGNGRGQSKGRGGEGRGKETAAAAARKDDSSRRTDLRVDEDGVLNGRKTVNLDRLLIEDVDAGHETEELVALETGRIRVRRGSLMRRGAKTGDGERSWAKTGG